MKDTGIVDCHLHIIDHGRYPFRPGVGYTPRPDESGLLLGRGGRPGGS